MPRKRKIAADDNQPSLFPEVKPVKLELAMATSRIARILEEDALIRSSFTSKEQYYISPQWQYKRLQKLRQAGHKCERCGSTGVLDVHHLNYDTLYDEDMSDLQVLCRVCHPSADYDREHDSAFRTYLHKRFGDAIYHLDTSDYFEEFEDWYSSKTEYGW